MDFYLKFEEMLKDHCMFINNTLSDKHNIDGNYSDCFILRKHENENNKMILITNE